MYRFAYELAAVLLDGPQTDNAMLARLVKAFDGERPWMARLVWMILHGGAEDDEGEEGEGEGGEGEEGEGGEEEEEEEQDQEQLQERKPEPDQPEQLKEREPDQEPDQEPEQLQEPKTALQQLVESLLYLPAFHDAVRERPLTRRWSEPPAMRESPWRLPALATSRELAVWLGTTVDALTALADVRGISRKARDERRRHYRYTWIAKRSGYRLLEAPKARLRTLQRYVLDDVLAHIPPHPAAHGFRAGRSVTSFAEPHVGREVVIRLDLQAFFTSVSGARVAAIFRAAGYPERVAHTLAALCTHRTPSDILYLRPRAEHEVPGTVASLRALLRAPHLPQGAPTSGALANLAAFGLDVRVSALATSLGASYTRYADDLVISGGRDLVRAAPTIVARVGAIAIEEGFSLNFRKTRVMAAASQQRVTGLVVNDKLAVPRAEIERLRAILYNCARTGPEPQNRDNHADFRAHLMGRISWIASVDATKGARLRTLFERIRWPE